MCYAQSKEREECSPHRSPAVFHFLPSDCPRGYHTLCTYSVVTVVTDSLQSSLHVKRPEDIEVYVLGIYLSAL